jgi:hypothetical protein
MGAIAPDTADSSGKSRGIIVKIHQINLLRGIHNGIVDITKRWFY